MYLRGFFAYTPRRYLLETVVFLAPYHTPVHAYRLAHRLIADGVLVAAVAGASCAAAQPVLDGMAGRLTRLRSILCSPFPCCDNQETSALLASLSAVAPSERRGIIRNSRAYTDLGVRTIWAIEAWERAHRRQTSVLVLNPLVIQIALICMTNGYILPKKPGKMGPFRMCVGTSGREVTLPSQKVIYIPPP